MKTILYAILFTATLGVNAMKLAQPVIIDLKNQKNALLLQKKLIQNQIERINEILENAAQATANSINNCDEETGQLLLNVKKKKKRR
jgi:hypothetical protein